SNNIDNTISSNIKVKSVKSSHEAGETVVICKDSVDVVEIKKLIVGLGHRITDTAVESVEEKKGLFSFFKRK
ncbi:MAG: hypothetical protein IJ033_03265, partial [Clostridia bacterium]|nr:hypothetical protein [Clostridia bacterium]